MGETASAPLLYKAIEAERGRRGPSLHNADFLLDYRNKFLSIIPATKL